MPSTAFGRDAAVHHPHAIELAVESFDFLQEGIERGLIAGVAGQDFVGQRVTFGRDDQRNDHLHTIGALVAAVAEAALVPFGKGRIALEIRRSQIVEQHVELRAEEVLPTRLQMFEQRVAVFEQPVQRAIQTILVQHRQVQAQQLIQRGGSPPLAVQTPFAARIQQPINRQHLQNGFPIGAFATGRQALSPEGVQLQLLPEQTGEPTGAPLAGPLQRKFREAHLHRLSDMHWHLALRSEERQLREGLPIGVEDFDGFDPSGLLAVIDLAQIKNRSLHPVALRGADLFGDTPVTMILAVFESVMSVEKRFAHKDRGHITPAGRWVGRE